jgi:hypothetical protein
MKLPNYLLAGLLCISFAFTSCKKDDDDDNNNNNPSGPSNLGWKGSDDPSQIPSSITNNFGFGNTNLPASVDLTPKFPPIGDQGQYGTCVAWAAGYNLKTALNGLDLNLSPAQLASPANQYSPKDLFWSIPDSKKGSGCNGTNFTDALDVMLSRGVATLQTVPYTNLGSCNSSGVQSNWTTEAAQNKIKSYRKIEGSVNSLKQQLANNVPVVIGAKLADNFMSWNSDDVFTSNTTYNQVGQHAYHALIISGYDDSKGPNGAFRVVNSWGGSWGDVGYIWVDYNFMVNTFAFGGNFYIANNEQGNNPPPPVDPGSTGVDLAPWVFGDYSTYNLIQVLDPSERAIFFNLYNIGSAPATSTSDWKLYYIYYNAFDANDYGILFYDEFNTSVAQNTYNCPDPNHCILNIDIPSGNNLGTVAFNTDTMYQIYYTPSNLNGYYYLVLIADAFDAFTETDEMNNIFYTTWQSPKLFVNGYSEKSSAQSSTSDLFSRYAFLNPLPVNREQLKSHPYRSAVTPQRPNAYSPGEIKELLRLRKKDGDLARKVSQYRMSGKQTAIRPWKNK